MTLRRHETKESSGGSSSDDVAALPTATESRTSATLSSIAPPNYECPVCCDTLRDPVSTECGHTFCEDCIDRWANATPTCPVCKQAIRSLPAVNILLRETIEARYPGRHLEARVRRTVRLVRRFSRTALARRRRLPRADPPLRVAPDQSYDETRASWLDHRHRIVALARLALSATMCAAYATKKRRLQTTVVIFVGAYIWSTLLGSGVSNLDASQNLNRERVAWQRNCFATAATGDDVSECDKWVPEKVWNLEQTLTYHSSSLFDAHVYTWYYPSLALANPIIRPLLQAWNSTYQSLYSIPTDVPSASEFVSVVPVELPEAISAPEAILAPEATSAPSVEVWTKVLPHVTPRATSFTVAEWIITLAYVAAALFVPRLLVWYQVGVQQGFVRSDPVSMYVLLEVAINQDLEVWRTMRLLWSTPRPFVAAWRAAWDYYGRYSLETYLWSLFGGSFYLRFHLMKYGLEGASLGPVVTFLWTYFKAHLPGVCAHFYG
jgi:hypothetical protein